MLRQVIDTLNSGYGDRRQGAFGGRGVVIIRAICEGVRGRVRVRRIPLRTRAFVRRIDV